MKKHRKPKKVELSRLERRKILNLYARRLINASEIYNRYGWTVEELSLVRPISEEHYLIKCPKCNSDSVAMSRHYTNVGVSCVSAVCRDCGTSSLARDFVTAMVKWNKEEVRLTH